MPDADSNLEVHLITHAAFLPDNSAICRSVNFLTKHGRRGRKEGEEREGCQDCGQQVAGGWRSHSTICEAVGRSSGFIWVQALNRYLAMPGQLGGSSSGLPLTGGPCIDTKQNHQLGHKLDAFHLPCSLQGSSSCVQVKDLTSSLACTSSDTDAEGS